MNKELQKLYEWLCINRLTLNVSKTNFIIFHAINKPKVPVTILINKCAMEETKYVKYLGVLIDPQLSFKFHIAELSKKVSRSIGILYKLRHLVTTKILLNIYYVIIYPFLLYGIIIWAVPVTPYSILSIYCRKCLRGLPLLMIPSLLSMAPFHIPHTRQSFYFD